MTGPADPARPFDGTDNPGPDLTKQAPNSGYAPPPAPGVPGYGQAPAAPGYAQTPPPGYQTPPPGYGQAPAGYQQGPPPGYGAPVPGYGTPPPGYGAPMAGPYGQPPAPNGPGHYDQTSGLFIPAGTELASVGRRIGAYFLALPLAIITLGIGYLIWGLVVWGKGTTPALQVLGMRVWSPDQQRPATFGTMALREIVGRIVDSILSLITLLVSFIMFASSPKRQSLHDRIANTVVLYDPNKTLG